jgi:hypothetical protein
VLRVLLAFVESRRAEASTSIPLEDFGTVASPFATAVLALARNQHPPARAIVAAKLEAAPAGDDRLALEVALACYDGGAALRPEHVAARIDAISEAAWRVLTTDGATEPPLDFVTAAARSGSFRARDQAAGMLRKRGLQLLSREVRDRPAPDPIAKNLRGREAIDACTTAMAGNSDVSQLLRRRGREYINLGDYAAARRDLRNLRADGDPEALVLACAALGRFSEAHTAVNFLQRDRARSPEESIEQHLRARAFLAYARGEFASAAADYAAAQRVGNREESLIFEHLALLHQGEGARSAMHEWSPFVLGLETDEVGLGWPDAALLHLQGKLSTEQMLAAAQAPRNQEMDAEQSCEAHLILAELARIKGDTATERGHLAKCLETEAFYTESYVLALLRIEELRESTSTP